MAAVFRLTTQQYWYPSMQFHNIIVFLLLSMISLHEAMRYLMAQPERRGPRCKETSSPAIPIKKIRG